MKTAITNNDTVGTIESLIDGGAMIPALVGGSYGVVFSIGYGIVDNILAPELVPSMVEKVFTKAGGCQ